MNIQKRKLKVGKTTKLRLPQGIKKGKTLFLFVYIFFCVFVTGQWPILYTRDRITFIPNFKVKFSSWTVKTHQINIRTFDVILLVQIVTILFLNILIIITNI